MNLKIEYTTIKTNQLIGANTPGSFVLFQNLKNWNIAINANTTVKIRVHSKSMILP